MKTISLYEFGGSEDSVRRIQGPLVRHFRGFEPVLDIGCGRGVFLELLAAEGIPGRGVDHSDESIRACLAKGLDVCQDDATAHLTENLGRYGGIFCSHVIEHMAYDDVINFLELCHSALRDDGRLLLMTPNPEDVGVMGELFWLDPTHVRPYPLALLVAMLNATGFEVVEKKQYLGSLRDVGRRRLPAWFLKRLVFGRNFGRPNTLVLARRVAPARPS